MDRSRLTGLISSKIAPRVEACLPAAWSANVVTWLGSVLMWLLLAGVIACPSPWRERLAPLWVALLWTYCVLDHVDGCRARLRRSSSAWGEFLDHALDAWHIAIAVFAIGAMGSAIRPGVVVVTLASVGLATAATWLEQKLRGEFTLGAIGPVEAVLAAGVYLALWTIPSAGGLLGAPVPGGFGLTWAEAGLLAGAAGCLVTAALVVRRTVGIAATLGAAALVAGAIVAVGASHHSWWGAGVVVALCFAEYSARIIVSHLTASATPWPDFVGALLLALALPVPSAAPFFATASALWLGGRAAVTWLQAAQNLAPTPSPAPAPATLALELD